MNFLKQIFSDRSGLIHNVVLLPGEVEEAVNFMRLPGRIDLSGLTLYARPYDVIPSEVDHTVIDIAVFPLPRGCNDHTCDLSKLGIGKREEFDGMPFLSLCHNGRLRIEKDYYGGHHTSIRVPVEGPMENHVKYGQVAVEHGGQDYEVLIANCDETGRKLQVTGQVVFDFSQDSADFGSPPPYHLVSISVFLFFAFCFVRVRFTTRTADEEATYRSVEMAAVETA
jgi:hypothetical protein